MVKLLRKRPVLGKLMLTKSGYRIRIVDGEINKVMSAFGAVSIEGPRWCGKTWTTLNHAASVNYIADPDGNFQNRTLASASPSSALIGPEPRAIDEWQEVPSLWDAVRFEVDQKQTVGRFLLTGSVTPPSAGTVHSGIGRIARIRMRPMTLWESGDSTGEISLEAVLSGHDIYSNPSVSLEDLIWLTVRGGWPASVAMSKESAQQIPQKYFEMLESGDLPHPEGIRRNREKMSLLLRSLARNNQSMVSYRTLQTDIELRPSDGVKMSDKSIATYLDDLEKLYIIERQNAWSPGMRSRKRVRVSPKIRYVDPSLACAALGATTESLYQDLSTFGLLFESLCVRDMAVYAQALNARIYHYRDETGLESDIILEMNDGRWAAFEVKLSADKIDEGSQSLLTLKNKMMRLGASEPLCQGVICGHTQYGYRTPEGIYVLPITSLRP